MEVSTPPMRSMPTGKREDTGAVEGRDAAEAVTPHLLATFSPLQAPPLLAAHFHV